MTAMAQYQPDGYDAISDKVAAQCGMTVDQVYGFLETAVTALNNADIIQERDITLEGVSHLLPWGDPTSPTFCQDGFNTYVAERLKNESATEPPLPKLGHHYLSITLSQLQVQQPDYPIARVKTTPGASCMANVYYTDGTSPKPAAWKQYDWPRRQIMPSAGEMDWGWKEQSAAYGGDFTVTCNLNGSKYAKAVHFDILPILWPQGQ
jgi:hypothetical protein